VLCNSHVTCLQFRLELEITFAVRVFDLLTEQQSLFKEEHMALFALLQDVFWIEDGEGVLQQDLTESVKTSLFLKKTATQRRTLKKSFLSR